MEERWRDPGLLAAVAPKVAWPARVCLIDPNRTELSTSRRGLANAGSDLLGDPAGAVDEAIVGGACHLTVLFSCGSRNERVAALPPRAGVRRPGASAPRPRCGLSAPVGPLV